MATHQENHQEDLACDDHAQAPDPSASWAGDPMGAFARWANALRHRDTEFEAHSLRQYLSMWSRYCTWLQATGMALLQVSPADIERFLLGLRGGRKHDRPVAASTKRRYLFLLHRAYAHLQLLGAIRSNPVAQLPELARHQARQRPARILLTPQQETAYIEWCMAQPTQRWEQMRNRALRLVLMGSGITVAEARMLKVTDVVNFVFELLPHVDLDDVEQDFNSHPQANGRQGRQGAGVLLVPAHGRVAARQAPLAGFALEVVEEWIQARPLGSTGMRLFPAGRPHGLCSILDPDQGHMRPTDDPLSAEEIYGIVATAMRAIGFDGARAGPATLRNTFMARQIRRGIPLERLRDWVGLHTTDELRELQRQVPRRLDGIWPG